jgi:hypothetical protein
MPIRNFSDSELLERACLRVAMFMRGMWEEKGSSDSRLLFDPWIPDKLVIAGRSRACVGEVYREHVVPRVHIANEVHRMFAAGCTDQQAAFYIREHVKIVEITKAEAARLDGKSNSNVKTKMPDGWQPGGDIYARLKFAGIEWDPISPVVTEVCSASRVAAGYVRHVAPRCWKTEICASGIPGQEPL